MPGTIVPPRKELLDLFPPDNTYQPLWRLGCWGVCAVLALALVVMVTQTQSGKARLRMAINASLGQTETREVTGAQPRGSESTADLRRLEQTVHALAADRDRLANRLASLERQIEDVTGSIKTVTDVTSATQAATASKRKITEPPAPAPAAPVQVVNFPPIITMLPPPVAAATVPPRESARQTETKALAPTPAVPKSEPLPGQRAAKSDGPQPTAAPLPQIGRRSDGRAPMQLTAITNEPARPSASVRHDIGIDVAGAQNMEAVRSQWAAVKSNYGPLLVGLHPVASPGRRSTGQTEYRLILGPLPNLGAAAGLCAQLSAAGAFCQPGQFSGEELR